jgi:hypothetical protein
MTCSFVFDLSNNTVTNFEYCHNEAVGRVQGNPYCDQHGGAIREETESTP